MLIAVVLGNRLNDDGSITDIMRERINLIIEVEKKLSPKIIILSGGVANPRAGKSEAQAMFEKLCEQGVDANKLVREDKSMTTKQNAKFSVPIAQKLGGTEILLCTTPEHMNRKFLNPIKLFQTQLRKYDGIKLIPCSSVEDIANEAAKRNIR